MKKRGKIWFFVIFVIILLLTVTNLFGVSSRYGDIVTPIVKSVSEIRFGIDIQGGVDVTFVPAEGVEANETQMEAAQAVIEQRLISLGITDYELYKDVDRSRIILRFPWQSGETEFNPETAIQELEATAVLTFREGYEVDDYGAPTGVTAENIILEGADVVQADALYGQVNSSTSEYYVRLTLSEEGRAKFSEATAKLAAQGGSISIWMDDAVISNPTVNEAIDSETAVITGSFTAEDAKSLADKINAGSLPFALSAESYSTISPTLGSTSLRAMVIAGIMALILVIIFMMVMYRLPGFVGSISLIGQVMAMLALISGYFVVFNSFTLTLPGIAGIILAIGMGVDANVITSERIKEELRSGKKLDAAIKAGYQRGLPTIVDGNVTVLIVAAILMGAFGTPDSFFGTILRPFFFAFGTTTAGTIYSFGYTLMVGVILNFVFGIFCNRVMLTSLSKFKFLRKPQYYGGLKPGQVAPVTKPIGFIKNRKKYFTFSGILIAVILVCSFVFGVKADVQFRGGAIITYSYDNSFEESTAQGIVDETLGDTATLQLGDNAATGKSTLTITLPGSQTVDAAALDTLTENLNAEFPAANFEQLEVNNVDATLGHAFLWKCVVAVLLAAVLIMIYVGIRFRKIGGWRGGLTAVVALVHDLIIVYGVFVILGIPLGGNFIAAMLTILGYSINDTVVIYDRVRENRRLHGKRMPFGDLVNLSINQSLRRSINTTVTTLMAIGCVVIFSLVYGLDSIFTFATPIMIGMVSGVYSSVCLAGPLWAMWNARHEKDSSLSLKGGKAAKQPVAIEATAGDMREPADTDTTEALPDEVVPVNAAPATAQGPAQKPKSGQGKKKKKKR
ncbi:MAG: protein translocase subunit SecF [Ruminococcaceae bacterium]|nr:protein translocase subunit SecF [Oscillospiraceae bacterium]